ARPETGWAVLDATDAEGAAIVLVGPLVHLEERERAHVTGTWEDSRYGRQVKVSEAHPLPPTDADADAVIAYLRRVKHVAAKRAYELTSVFGVGFLTADRIARRLGASPDDPGRTRAAILHVLSEAERSGSTCLPLNDLLAAANELLASIEVGEADVDALVDA